MSIWRRAGSELGFLIERAADPGGAVNQIQLYAKDVLGITQFFAQDSIGVVHQLTPPFGAGFGSVVEVARTTTTSSIFQNKVTLPTGTRIGICKVTWMALVDNQKSEGEFRLQNVTDAITLTGTIIEKSTSNDDIFYVGGTINDLALTGVSKDLVIQFRDASPGNKVQGIQQARIDLWEV